MSHTLRCPFEDEDPKNLGTPQSVLVERLAVGKDGELMLQGRLLLSDGTRGKVRTWPLEEHAAANLFYARATGRRCSIFITDPEDIWAQTKARIEQWVDQ